MNKLFLFFFFGAIIFSSCSNAPTAAELRAEAVDRAQVTTLAITASIPSDTGFRHQLRRRVESAEWHNKFEKRSERNRVQPIIDTLKHLLDTGAIYLSIADSLIDGGANYLKKVQEPDSNPQSLYKQIENWDIEPKTFQKGHLFNIHDCLPIVGFKVYLRSKPQKIKDSLFFAGTIQVSQVCFNKKRTRAFMTTYFYCGNLCAAQYFIFIEKRKGKWFLVMRDMGVVS